MPVSAHTFPFFSDISPNSPPKPLLLRHKYSFYFISDNMTEDLLYGSAPYITKVYSSVKALASEMTVISLKNEGFDKPMIDRIMSAK
jgi:hypothetical protein